MVQQVGEVSSVRGEAQTQVLMPISRMSVSSSYPDQGIWRSCQTSG